MDQESDDGLTPVIIACQNGNAEQLKDLLEEGVCWFFIFIIITVWQVGGFLRFPSPINLTAMI